MTVYYFDSSAIVKRYVNEPGSSWIRQCAASLAQRYPLKAYDAVQLSLALHANALLNVGGLSLTLVSGDDQLLRAAQAEGLAADNPFVHTP